MEKEYKIVFETVEGKEETSMKIDKENLNDMFMLVDYLIAKLTDIYYSNEPERVGLMVCNGKDVLFDSEKSLEEYQLKNKIKGYMDSSFSTYIEVNDIPYHGEIVEGMLVGELVSDKQAEFDANFA